MPTTRLCRIDPLQNSKVADALGTGDLSPLVTLHEELPYHIDAELLRQLVAIALRSHSDIDPLDQWLAPRLHCAIRIPRAVAGDSGVWTWLAVHILKQYVDKRFGFDLKNKDPWWRYKDTGILRNAIARLWWAAELVRSGPDYRLVPEALRKVRVFQNVGELRYSWHREAARAFTRVLTEYSDAGDELSVVFNAYLASSCLETFDSEPSELEQRSWDAEWGTQQPTLKGLTCDVSDLEGPHAGFSRRAVEDSLYKWLNDVMDETVTQRS